MCRKKQFPVTIFSEEHGKVDCTARPQYTGMLDGIVGTHVCKNVQGNTHYGTVFGVYKRTDPSYDDYLVGGFAQHLVGTLFLAMKRQGVRVVKKGSCTRKARSSKCRRPDFSTRIRIDECREYNQRMFKQKLQECNILPYERSSARRYVDFAKGLVDAICECTRKGNLALAGFGYLVVREVEGVVLAVESGESIGPLPFYDWGQNDAVGDECGFVAAPNLMLAKQIITRVTS